jgi:hypothetical protein
MLAQQLTFEGLEPVGVRTAISGKTTSIQRPLAIGEEVLIVVRGTVQGVNHAVDKDGLLFREHKVVVGEAYELGSRDGEAVLQGKADAAMRHQPLPFDLPFDGEERD